MAELKQLNSPEASSGGDVRGHGAPWRTWLSAWPLALAALASLLLAWCGETCASALQFERMAIASGEWWRLLAAHLVHLPGRHAAYNLAALLLLLALYGRHFGALQWLAIVLVSQLAIDAGLWGLERDLQWYRGASGYLHGAWVAGALAEMRWSRQLGWLSVALLAAKLAYEQWSGASTLLEGMPVVVDAHLYGALGGLAAAAWCLRRGRSPL